MHLPNPERSVASDVAEVLIARQHDKIVPYADLGKQGIDGTYLNATPTTCVAQSGRLDVIVHGRHDHRDIGEALDDLLCVAWASPPLQQLLKHQPSRADRLAIHKCIP